MKRLRTFALLIVGLVASASMVFGQPPCPTVSGVGCDSVAWSSGIPATGSIVHNGNTCYFTVFYCYRTNGCGEYEVWISSVQFLDSNCVSGLDLLSDLVFQRIMTTLAIKNPWGINTNQIPNCPQTTSWFYNLVLAPCFQADFASNGSIELTPCQDDVGCTRQYHACWEIDPEGSAPPQLIITEDDSIVTLTTCDDPGSVSGGIIWTPQFGSSWSAPCTAVCD